MYDVVYFQNMLSALSDCKFTCHYRCRPLIRLDCSWDRSSTSDYTCVVEHAIETDTNVVRATTSQLAGGHWKELSVHFKIGYHQIIPQLIVNRPSNKMHAEKPYCLASGHFPKGDLDIPMSYKTLPIKPTFKVTCTMCVENSLTGRPQLGGSLPR